MGEGIQRKRYLYHHSHDLLRLVNLPGHVAIKRVHRIGRWLPARPSLSPTPRPVMVEFGNSRFRD